MNTGKSIRICGVTAIAALAFIGPSLASAQPVKPQPRVIAADEGVTSVGENGFITWIKVGSESTGASQLYVGNGIVPPGSGTPLHLHEIDEEVLYVLDGEITLVLNDKTHVVTTGGTAFIPPGTWMQVSNRSDKPARVLGILGRGDVEKCFRAIYPAEGAYETPEERQKDFAFCKTRLAEQGKAEHHQALKIDGEIEIRKRMNLSLSCDHRVVDGWDAASFLADMKPLVENPLRLLA